MCGGLEVDKCVVVGGRCVVVVRGRCVVVEGDIRVLLVEA